jgi:hypothetical protein
MGDYKTDGDEESEDQRGCESCRKLLSQKDLTKWANPVLQAVCFLHCCVIDTY